MASSAWQWCHRWVVPLWLHLHLGERGEARSVAAGPRSHAAATGRALQERGARPLLRRCPRAFCLIFPRHASVFLSIYVSGIQWRGFVPQLSPPLLPGRAQPSVGRSSWCRAPGPPAPDDEATDARNCPYPVTKPEPCYNGSLGGQKKNK